MNCERSRPDARMPAGSVQRRPLIHSITSTRGPHRSGRTHGIFTVASFAKLRPKSCAAASHRLQSCAQYHGAASAWCLALSLKFLMHI